MRRCYVAFSVDGKGLKTNMFRMRLKRALDSEPAPAEGPRARDHSRSGGVPTLMGGVIVHHSTQRGQFRPAFDTSPMHSRPAE